MEALILQATMYLIMAWAGALLAYVWLGYAAEDRGFQRLEMATWHTLRVVREFGKILSQIAGDLEKNHDTN